MEYRVQLEEFQGPLDLLLQVIEKNELDITEVSLAQVADQFITYVNSIEEERPEELVDFLVIASRLMLIKSKSLLPMLEFEGADEEAEDLERQLRMYKQFARAAEDVEKMWKSDGRMSSRTKLKADIAQTFYPPEGVTVTTLRESFEAVLGRIKTSAKEKQQKVRKVLNLKSRIMHIRGVLFDTISVGFSKLVGNKQNKTEVVVTFLALLELVKQKAVTVEQGEQFTDITITGKGNTHEHNA